MSSSQNAHPKPDANCPPVASLIVADFHQSESNDSKPDVQKFVKYSKKTIEKEDVSGTSVAPSTLEFKANSVKLENMSAKGTDFHISTVPSKYVATSMAFTSAPDESTLDNSCSHAPSELECTKKNQVISNTLKSAALDDRLNWDLNTVMAWEEQLECDHNMNSCKERKSKHCERGRECGSVSKNIGNENSPVELKSLIPKIEKSELEERKPVCNDMRNLLSPFINSAPPVAVNKINCLFNQHAGSSIPNVVPSALTLKYPVHEVSAKQVSVMAAGTDFTFMPLGLGHGLDIRASDKNIISSKIIGSESNVNHSIPSVQTTENDKLNLSLITAPSLENEVHRNQSTFDEDDKANVKRVITSNGIAIGNLISRGTGSSQNIPVSSKTVGCGNYVNHAMTDVQTNENEKLKLSLVTEASTETVVHQSGSIFDDEDDKAKVKRIIANKGITIENPIAAVSSMHDVVCSEAQVPLQSGKSRTGFPNDIISNNKEVCDYENIRSDVLAGSDVDEVSFGYDDSQFEDGEFRESSIQTWEGNDGEDREIEHGTENRGAFGTHENDSLKSTDVGSQKGTDEISSVLLPEKLDSSDHIYDSETNVTESCTTEVNMKDASQSDQWKMNVPGSDILPENRSSSSNNTKIKDFNSIKSSSRVTEDLETKAEVPRFYRREPSTSDAFLSTSRFRMQGSSSNADDSASRSVRDSGVIRSVGRGKYTRGGGMWDRSPSFPGPSFRRSLPEDDNLTDKVGVDPHVTRGSFRSRLMVNSEEDEFRARLGLRPAGDTCHNLFVNVGRGRSLRYGSRLNDAGPREGYYGHPDNDEPSMDYSHSFPARRRCFSPTHHHSGSTSPPRSRTRSPIGSGFRGRSRSPLRSDTRMRREPNYRHGFEPDHVGGYSLEQSRNNNSPPSSRFVKYKQRSFVFDRRSSPPPPSGERLSFYEPSRKTKQNENYRSSRFSDLHGGGRDGCVMDHGYRRGGFVRPYDMGRPAKHIQYNEEDGYGPPVYDSRDKEALEFHGRGNLKPYLDISRRVREERDKW
ncbi:hypothetical protein L1987_72006 [Smallanthus sonchifolius]|uniref:Uncharacterized protein n=1 Tax=Smallanthus sonchifolius TaxID=185202 RepID=A0ACB9AT59_9ASTR|nr:hypothetical protein L1987_72006 [Smallanthus sonchifolius]